MALLKSSEMPAEDPCQVKIGISRWLKMVLEMDQVDEMDQAYEMDQVNKKTSPSEYAPKPA